MVLAQMVLIYLVNFSRALIYLVNFRKALIYLVYFRKVLIYLVNFSKGQGQYSGRRTRENELALSCGAKRG